MSTGVAPRIAPPERRRDPLAALAAVGRYIHGDRRQAAAPVRYTTGLVTFVGALAVGSICLAALTVRGTNDLAGTALVGGAIFAMSLASIRPAGAKAQVFTPTSFLHLGLALTVGPAGCLTAATAEALGMHIHGRTGWFRSVFNVSALFCADLAALGTYQVVRDAGFNHPLWLGVAGLAAGAAQFLVNHLLVSLILLLAVGTSPRRSFVGFLGVLPYFLSYGYAALAFVVVHDRFGAVGFTFALAPILALQSFLLVHSHRTRAHEQQRDDLLLKLRDASDRVERSYDATLVALTHALDARDKETEGHSRRVVEYTRLIATELGLGGEELKLICHGALLHDIGKIGVPDSILHKPAPLTEAEWQVMRRHPEIGALMVEEVEYLSEARLIILHHHERWDGTGYPLGLRGAQISAGARAFAVADTVDAITQDRPYRRGQSFDKVREELIANRGRQFDPEAIDAFLRLGEQQLLTIVAMRARVDVDLLWGVGRTSLSSGRRPVLLAG